MYAKQFIAAHGLGSGYLGVQWRSEQDRTWYKRDLEKEFVGKIDAALAARNLTKVYLAVDFLGSGSTTMNPTGNKLSGLMKVYTALKTRYHPVTFDAATDTPEAHAANSNMLIAVSQCRLARATHKCDCHALTNP